MTRAEKLAESQMMDDLPRLEHAGIVRGIVRRHLKLLADRADREGWRRDVLANEVRRFAQALGRQL